MVMQTCASKENHSFKLLQLKIWRYVLTNKMMYFKFYYINNDVCSVNITVNCVIVFKLNWKLGLRITLHTYLRTQGIKLSYSKSQTRNTLYYNFENSNLNVRKLHKRHQIWAEMRGKVTKRYWTKEDLKVKVHAKISSIGKLIGVQQTIVLVLSEQSGSFTPETFHCL